MPEENILREADKLTAEDRRGDYGHPLDDYNRTAALFNAAFADKLSSPFAAEDMMLAMILVKVSRQRNKPKRDNLTDICGYARCIELAEQERKNRK